MCRMNLHKDLNLEKAADSTQQILVLTYSKCHAQRTSTGKKQSHAKSHIFRQPRLPVLWEGARGGMAVPPAPAAVMDAQTTLLT
jgi:hypothetical protein